MVRFAVGESRLINRNVVGIGGRTSMRLEPEFWQALAEIARREGVSIAETIRVVELALAEAGHAGGRTSAVRVYIVRYFRDAATAEGHLQAGHGALG
jgi:predicted DNA-binding ribbon-helix-helix protein